MVDFEGYYLFAADQVEYIGSDRGNSETHPFSLTVSLKSGKTMTVNYKTQKARDDARRVLLNRISHELRSDYEQLYNKLYLIDDAVKRIDKRQLRIWRQLRALLSLTVEEGDEP